MVQHDLNEGEAMSTDRSPARIGIAERTDMKGRTLYRGTAYDKRARRHLKGPWTPHLAEARAWRVDAQAKLQAGTLSAAQGPTVREAAEQFIEGMKSGAIRNRSGHRYRPSVVTGYKRELREDPPGARRQSHRAPHPERTFSYGPIR